MPQDAIRDLVARRPELAPIEAQIRAALEMLVACFAGGHTVLVCGNGGSCADADHIVGELVKGFLSRRPLSEPAREEIRQAVARAEGDKSADEARLLAKSLQQGLPAINLAAHASLLTAFSNDVCAEYAYAQQVLAYGRPGDVLVGISTSGNARNVVWAAAVARARGLGTIGLSGGDGGRLSRFCDVCILAPAGTTPEVQELHLPIYHALCAGVEARLFGS